MTPGTLIIKLSWATIVSPFITKPMEGAFHGPPKAMFSRLRDSKKKAHTKTWM